MLKEVRIKKLHSKACLPAKAYLGDVAYDLCAVEDFVIPAIKVVRQSIWNEEGTAVYDYKWHAVLNPTTIPLGFSAEFDSTYGAFIKDKSGLAAKSGLHVMAGVIEGTFRGEWKVIMLNWSDKDYIGKAGQKIAQVVFQPKESPLIYETENLSESVRGIQGWGSSGL